MGCLCIDLLKRGKREEGGRKAGLAHIHPLICLHFISLLGFHLFLLLPLTPCSVPIHLDIKPTKKI